VQMAMRRSALQQATTHGKVRTARPGSTGSAAVAPDWEAMPWHCQPHKPWSRTAAHFRGMLRSGMACQLQ